MANNLLNIVAALRSAKTASDNQGYPVDLTRPIVTDDEGVHTELSMTDKLGNKYINMPTIWNGKRYNPDVPAEYGTIMQNYNQAKQQGWKFPEFENVSDAVAAAKDRSQHINNLRGAELMAADAIGMTYGRVKKGLEK